MSRKYSAGLIALAGLIGLGLVVWLRTSPPSTTGASNPTISGPGVPSSDGTSESPGIPKKVVASIAARPYNPTWAVAPEIDFNDFYRRQRARQGASVELNWRYLDQYGTYAGSLHTPPEGGRSVWSLETFSGAVYDQIRGGSVQAPSGVSPVRLKQDTLVLRKGMTPISVWLFASLKGAKGIRVPTGDVARRLAGSLVLKRYSPRPGQVFSPRTEAPDAFQAEGSTFLNVERRWLPEMGRPGVVFQSTEILTARVGGVYLPNQDEDSRRHPIKTYSHWAVPAMDVETHLGDLKDSSGFLIEVILDVSWQQVTEPPQIVALQPFLDVGALGLPSLEGYAVPDPKEIVLAPTLTQMDAYAALRDAAIALEAKGDIVSLRRSCELLLTKFPHAMEIHEMLDDSYEGLAEHAAWLSVCRRALEAARSLGVDSVVSLDDSLETLLIDRRMERLRKLSREFSEYWAERIREVETLARKPLPPDK